MRQLSNAEHEEVEKLAYQLWEERGGALGSPDGDWFRAKEKFIRHSDSLLAIPISSPMLEPIEY